MTPDERRAYDRARYAANREKRQARARDWYHAQPEEKKAARSERNRAAWAARSPEERAKKREEDRARRASETAEQRQARIDAVLIATRRSAGVKNPTAERRDGMCAVRGCGYVGPLHLDHWHSGPAEGELRGWVCQNCNTAMGLAADSPDRLRALAEYIELAAGVGWPSDP
jgi:hypothetical protein